MENYNFVPSFSHNVFQKLLKNLVSWSKIIVLGIPYNLTTSLKNKEAMLEASSLL
jgi:hypothetical protein